MHIDDIIDALDAYLTSIGKPCNVVEFGVSAQPQAPYVTVKQERGGFRIITHVMPGQQAALRVLVRKDIQDALLDKTIGTVRLEADPVADTPGPIIQNDDGTISQERLFQSADRIY